MEALTRVSIQIFSSYHSTPNNVDYSITLQSCSSNLSDFIFRENGTKAWHSLSKRKHKPTWGAHGVNALCRMHIAEQSCQTWQSAKQSYKEPETEPHYVFLSTPRLKVNQAFFVLKKNELTDTKYTCNRFMENARMLLCMGSAVAPSLSHLLSGNQSWGARENTHCHAHM